MSSTVGAVRGSGLASKRKRGVSDDDIDESSETTPSKKPNLTNA